jgi:DNA-binding NtrC family response regulator
MERNRLRRRAHRLEGTAALTPSVWGAGAPRSPPPEPVRAERPPAILIVAAAADVRNAVARELARDFELINALSFTSAVRKLAARPALAAIIVDLALTDRHGASWFLARLVDHAYDGPRILLSGALGAEHASSMRRGSVSHFMLASPWPHGELRSSIVTALGCYGQLLQLAGG